MFKIGQKIQIKPGINPIRDAFIGKIVIITSIQFFDGNIIRYYVEPCSIAAGKLYEYPAWLYEDEIIPLESSNEISIF